MKREKPNLLSVKNETAILFCMKRDQYLPLPPSLTTLYDDSNKLY